jgi:hypothetical protein
MQPGTVAHTCIPSYSGGGDKEDHSSPREIVHKTPSQQMAGYGDTHLSSQLHGEVQIERSRSRRSSAKSETPT